MNSTDDEPKSTTEPTDEVGYGKPPKTTRFKKGLSGNPRGRPRGSLNAATVFRKAMNEKVVVNENGKRKTVSKLEAAVKQMVNKAASGDIRAWPAFIEAVRDVEATQNARESQNPVADDQEQEILDGLWQRLSEAKGKETEDEQEEAKDEINKPLEARDVKDQCS